MVGVAVGHRSRRERPGRRAPFRARRAGRPRRPPRKGEEGFTLIELLIVLIIVPLVTGAIATVIITSLQDQTGIQSNTSDSGDAAVSSAYYVRDIESASAVTTAGQPKSIPAQCSTQGLQGSTSFILGVELLAGKAVVSYYVQTPIAGGPSQLVRLFCPNGSTPQSQVVLSHNFNPAASVPVVSCVNPTPQGVPPGVTCSPAAVGQDWVPAYMVSNVTMNVTQGCPSPPGPPCTAFQYSLTADPVSGVPVQSVVQVPGALTLLGAGPDIQFQGSNSSVCAAGPILLKSGYGNGTAITSTQGGDKVTSGSACGTATSNGIDIFNCRNDGTSGNPCPSGPNNPVGSGVTVSPSPPVSAAQVNDPLQNWASQSQNQVPAVSSPSHSSSSLTADCTPSDHNTDYSCPAGIYPQGLVIPDNETVTFQGGTNGTQFGQVSQAGDHCDCALIIGNSDTVFFDTGYYSYEGGLSMTGVSSALCAGSGTGPCAGAPTGGVFFYVNGGQVDFGSVSWTDFVGKADVVQLSPITTSTDPYDGILIWQNQSDNDAIELVGYLSSSNAYNGEIYAPDSPMQIYGLGFSVSTGNIVADMLTVFSGLGGATSIDVQ